MKKRPMIPWFISVLPLGSRWALPTISVKKLSGGSALYSQVGAAGP